VPLSWPVAPIGPPDPLRLPTLREVIKRKVRFARLGLRKDSAGLGQEALGHSIADEERSPVTVAWPSREHQLKRGKALLRAAGPPCCAAKPHYSQVLTKATGEGPSFLFATFAPDS
jgi:hypothetical protein